MFFYFLEGITILASIICIMYFIMIACFCYGWINTPKNSIILENPISVAVIIVARNEENIIASCLESLIHQTYLVHNFEIIVVDDSSTDSTGIIVQRFASSNKNIRLIQLSVLKLEGKKNAIASAISQTTAELIITTDADCIMGNMWLEKMVAHYLNTNAKMILGPVAFHHEKLIFEKMQSLEFMALIASTAGSLFYNKAIMCNGANLAYSKKVFNEIGGFNGINQMATGDDILLMYKIKQKYGEGIKFLKDKDAIVYTKAKASLVEFLSQRKRWASKGFLALNTETRLVSLLVYVFNFSLLFLGLISGFATLKAGIYLPFFKICLILIGIKCFIDFLLLFLAASFFDKKHFLFFFLPEQIIYIFYVVIVGMLGNKGKYMWKGRKIN